MALALFLVWCASTAGAMRYGDYSDVRMPHYGSLNDYDSPRDASQPDDYQGRSLDASASLDYKYDEDSRTRIDESTKEFDDSNWWRKRVRKQKKLGQATLEDKIKYDQENDEVTPFRLSSKHRTRYQDDFLNGDETPSERLKKYSRNRKDVSDLDKKKYVGKDLSENNRKKKYDDDMRQSKIRKTRDKHRTRKNIDSDLEKIRAQADIDDLDAYEDDDMQIERRLKGEFDKDVKLHSDKKVHDLKYTKSLHNNPDFDVVDRKREPIGHDDFSGSDMLENDSFTIGRDTPRRGPSRHKRPLDSRGYRPTVQDDEDDVETRVKKLKPSLPDDDYDNYFDMKSVQNIRSKLPSLLRRTTVAMTQTTGLSIAERELTAALSSHESRRRRKEAGFPPPTGRPPPTFAPLAVHADLQTHWNDFIAANSTKKLSVSTYLTFLALLNYIVIMLYV